MSSSSKQVVSHTCPVCGNSCNLTTQVYANVSGASLKRVNGFQIRACSVCGFCEIETLRNKARINNLKQIAFN